MKFANRINKIENYIFADLAKKVELVEIKSGKKVLNLGPGTPDIPPSQKYKEQLKQYLDQPKSHYYPGYKAIPELQIALQQWYKKRFNVDIQKDELQPVLGGKDAITHLPGLFINKGDEILIPDPGYPAFTGAATIWEADPVYYDISLQDIENKITSKTKLIFINFPSNPTGQTITKKELEKVTVLAHKHRFLIVYDNAYSEIGFDRYMAPSILEIPGAKEVSVEIGSFSKTFSFAGLRMGWVVGNQKVIQQFTKLKSQIDSGMSLPLQQLGAYVLTNQDLQWHAAMINTYQQRRDSLTEKLSHLELKFSKPQAGLYIWAEIPKGAESSYKFAMELLDSKQILVTPGSAFGKKGERFVRVSICSNIQNLDQYL
jgi:aspartate/methionine/tyrosine aminotransferase